MPLPNHIKDTFVSKLIHFCDDRNSFKKDKNVKASYRIHDDFITLYEEKPDPFHDGLWKSESIARLKYNDKTTEWVLYYFNVFKEWKLYLGGLFESMEIDQLLEQINRDNSGIFFSNS